MHVAEEISVPLDMSPPAEPRSWTVRFDRNGDTAAGHSDCRLHLRSDAGISSPKTARHSGYEVIFDGVLYNADALRARCHLEPLGGSDASAILQAYLVLGERALEEARGVYSFLLWDPHKQTLLGVRDALGFYPLFYAESGSIVYFSDSIDALRAVPEMSVTLSRTTLAAYVAHWWPRPAETLFEGVFRVPIGHAVRVVHGRIEYFRYWVPALAQDGSNWLREDELGEFDHVFDRAIQRCLRHGRPGLFLSGGIDSVSVAAVATDICRCEGGDLPLALSILFPDPSCDEEHVQRGIAKQLGLDHVATRFDDIVGDQGLLAHGIALSATLPHPMQNPWLPLYDYLKAEAAALGRTAILTGSGGDEWLTVDPTYSADLLYRLDLIGLYRLTRSYMRSYRLPALSVIRRTLWNEAAVPLTRSLLRSAADVMAPNLMYSRQVKHARSVIDSAPAWLAPDDQLRRAVFDRREQDLLSGDGPAKPGKFYSTLARREAHFIYCMDREEESERARRYNLHQVSPYWDVDIINLLSRTPPELLNRNGRNKGLVREMLARRFPGLGFDHQRKVLSLDFFRSTMLREGRRMWDEMGGTPTLVELGVVDGPAQGRMVDEIIRSNRVHDVFRIWDMLTLEAWVRTRA